MRNGQTDCMTGTQTLLQTNRNEACNQLMNGREDKTAHETPSTNVDESKQWVHKSIRTIAGLSSESWLWAKGQRFMPHNHAGSGNSPLRGQLPSDFLPTDSPLQHGNSGVNLRDNPLQNITWSFAVKIFVLHAT